MSNKPSSQIIPEKPREKRNPETKPKPGHNDDRVSKRKQDKPISVDIEDAQLDEVKGR